MQRERSRCELFASFATSIRARQRFTGACRPKTLHSIAALQFTGPNPLRDAAIAFANCCAAATCLSPQIKSPKRSELL